jgi:hypothetical protein
LSGAFFRVHHCARQRASPFPLLAAVGAKTHRIEIGTAVIDMRYENPPYMAEDAGETAHARTRGTGVLVYGDFEFCFVEVMAKPARRCRWWGLGE